MSTQMHLPDDKRLAYEESIRAEIDAKIMKSVEQSREILLGVIVGGDRPPG